MVADQAPMVVATQQGLRPRATWPVLKELISETIASRSLSFRLRTPPEGSAVNA